MPNKIPAPFKKDSISLTAHGKEWQTLPIRCAEVGDIVQGHGMVTAFDWVAYGDDLSITFQSGETLEGTSHEYPQYVIFTRKR